MGPMGGGGFMQAMNESLKNNKALLKEKSPFKGLGDKTDPSKKLVFKKSEDIDMYAFRKDLQKEKARKNRKKLALLILSIITTLLLLYFSNILIGKHFSGYTINW